MSDSMFKWAAEYAARGWHCVVCHGANGQVCTCSKAEKCGTPGKHPLLTDWPNKATTDEDELSEWLDGSKRRNLGVLLGEKSGIIDIEYDCEEGRKTAERFGLDKAYTPTFTSKRSTHRLFKYDSSLPQQATIKVDDLEIRIGGGGQGAQSIMPPSSHASGVSYAWVEGMSPSEVEVAEIPRELMIAISNHSEGGEAQTPKKPATAIIHTQVDQGDRHEALVKMAGYLCIKMFDPHDPFEQQMALKQLRAINDTQCVPPSPQDEVDSIFAYANRWAMAEKARTGIASDDEKKAAIKRYCNGEVNFTEGDETKAYTTLGLEFRDGEWWPGDWRLTVICGDPPAYTIRIPVYQSRGQTIAKTLVEVQVSAEVYRSSAKVAQAILEATHTVMVDAVPEDWALIWSGRGRRKNQPAIRGLKAKLMDISSEEEATAENCRYAAVASWLLDVLSMAPRPDDDDDDGGADPTGFPSWTRNRDGAWELWFSWSKVWEIVDRGRRKLEPADSLRCRRMIEKLTGGKIPSVQGHGEGGHFRRFTRFSDEHLRAVARIANGGVIAEVTSNDPYHRA